MPLATCLVRHLLYAAVEAYHPEGPARGGAARWTGPPPSPITGGRAAVAFTRWPEREIDFALVGRFDEGIVVAFRGTLPPLDLSPDSLRIVSPDARRLAILSDWLNNAQVHLVRRDGEPLVIPGAVHEGFAASLASLWPRIAAEIVRLGGEQPARLYFTGHSKGGALANLAALAARHRWPGATLRVATFGAPHAGDGDFARAYQDAGIVCRRYEVDFDLVPRVPMAGLAAEPPPLRALVPVGERLERSAIFHTPPVGRWDHFRFILPGRDDRWLIPPPIAAHLPYPSFGYGDHVCTDGNCTHDWQ